MLINLLPVTGEDDYFLFKMTIMNVRMFPN